MTWKYACLPMMFLAFAATCLAQGKKGQTKATTTSSRNEPDRYLNRPVYFVGPNNTPTYIRPPIIHGYNPRVRVQFEPRLPWNLTLPSSVWDTLPPSLGMRDASQTTYSIWVPRTYRHAIPHPAVLFISNKAFPDEATFWDPLCHKYNILFIQVHPVGPNMTPIGRMQVALDVFDDVRRRMAIDTDRFYIAGFQQGAATALDLAYSFPEYVGGAIAIGGAASPRQEPWLRDRARDRLNLALVTSPTDPLQMEMESLRANTLKDLGMTAQIWKAPWNASGNPPLPTLEQVWAWMEMGVPRRRQLALKYPTTRVSEGQAVPGLTFATLLLEEARARLKNPAEKEIGLMVLEGIQDRWRGSEPARLAGQMLDDWDKKSKTPWKTIYQSRQQTYWSSEAAGTERILKASLTSRDAFRKSNMVKELISLYEQIEKLDPQSPEGLAASRKLEEWKKQLPESR